MRLGGNEGWRTFFEEHEDTKMTGVGWDDATIAERYSGEVGEEWKERLTAKVEGREYVKGESQKRVTSPPAVGGSARQSPRTGTPLSGTANRSDSMGSNGNSTSGGKVKVDDRYFAKLGADNASRPDHVPPSQGGKYAGFGNTPGPAAGGQGSGGAPTLDEVQKDPMAALTKGFGWFTSTVSKTAKNVNDGYIQPTAKQVSFLYTMSRKAPPALAAMFHALTRLTTVRRRRLRPTSTAHSRPTRKAGPVSRQECARRLQPLRRGQR